MPVVTEIQKFEKGLYLIPLPVPIKGFDGFLGAWVLAGDPLILVDVGPAVSVPRLLSSLEQLDLGQPDLILLTHIHIDHAGGVGAVAEAFPRATVVCHPKGEPHLVDPDRLWKGSVKTLGDIARSYEPIGPVPQEQVTAADRFRHPMIRCIDTPGHAAHHTSYIIGDLLFAGEAGGVCLAWDDPSTYMRPATPPPFFLDTSLKSLDRLIAQTPKQICYAHLGLRADAVKMLKTHRSQLLHWLDMVSPFYRDSRDEHKAMLAAIEHLLANDPLLAGYSDFPPDIQERERGFLLNAMKGFWGYLDKMPD